MFKTSILYISILLIISLISCVNRKITNIQNKNIPYVILKEYGRYKIITEKSVYNKNLNNDVNIIRKWKLIEQTNLIPCVLGERFGIVFRLKRFPGKEEMINLKVHLKHPEITNPDGTTSIGSYSDWPIAAKDCKKYNLYFDCRLEKEYELVPGKRTISIYYMDHKLLEHTFNLVK